VSALCVRHFSNACSVCKFPFVSVTVFMLECVLAWLMKLNAGQMCCWSVIRVLLLIVMMEK